MKVGSRQMEYMCFSIVYIVGISKLKFPFFMLEKHENDIGRQAIENIYEDVFLLIKKTDLC